MTLKLLNAVLFINIEDNLASFSKTENACYLTFRGLSYTKPHTKAQRYLVKHIHCNSNCFYEHRIR